MPFWVFVNRVWLHSIAEQASRRRLRASGTCVERIRAVRGVLQGLELIDPLLGVALTDLPQRLVLVSAGLDVVSMEQVVLGLPVLVLGFFQLGTQGLRRRGDSCYGGGRTFACWNIKRLSEATAA